VLKRIIVLRDEYKGYSIEVVDRLASVSNIRKVDVSDIERVTKMYLVLKDGSIIPLHRVIGVVDSSGRRVWSRYTRG